MLPMNDLIHQLIKILSETLQAAEDGRTIGRTWFLKSTMTLVMTSVSVGSMYSVPLAPFLSQASNALCVLHQANNVAPVKHEIARGNLEVGRVDTLSGVELNRPLRALVASICRCGSLSVPSTSLVHIGLL